jgi:hypothetical protein
MSNVQRYTITGNWDVEESQDGNWVDYEDYEKLLQHIHAVNEFIDEFCYVESTSQPGVYICAGVSKPCL